MKGFKIIFLIVIISLSQSVAAQYFGENKVCYEKFDFTISSSPHFDIYNYLDNDKLLLSLNKQMENWYIRHYSIFGENTNNNAIIIYNNKPDFKQTNVISGLIGVGTGGVTEGFRKRIIMPLFTSNKEVNHVIGHELVHVFQYNMMKESDSLSLKSLQNTPLWMVEGLAEYMSLGSTHNKTAMWMRDAVYHNDIPSIKDMTRRPNEYFPYRYGHAFWAFLTGMYGDRIIQPFFYNTACYGMKKSVKNLFHISLDSLSCLWQSSIEEGFGKYIINNSPPVGKQPFNKNRLENINILPVLSPNGKKLAFLSNKNVISIDVLIADLESGEISNELTKPVTKAHIDDYNFIESAGSWSPDGKKYVMTSIAKGNNILLLLSSNNKKTDSKEIIIKGVDAFENPEWSPNNDKIVFTGLANGQSDLYLYDISENSTVQLTDDPYSDLQPSWSADGEKIIFISERGDDTDFSKPVFGKYRITELDVKSEKIKSYNNILPESDIFNVHYAEGDSAVYFLSHADGYRNLYKYNFFTDSLFRLTNYNTGISGITDLAPAFSISRQGKIAYTLFNDDGYHIYIANINDFSAQAIKKDFYSNDAEKLAPQKRKSNIVAINLKQYPFHYSIKTEKKKYSPHFGLEHLGSTSIGMATGYHERYASGGVTALFGDVLHRHQISGGIMIQGEIYDIGGAATYINNENRISWGVSASHIPYRYSQYYLLDRTIIEMNNQYHEVQDLIERRIRIFQDKATLFASLPFNQKTRVECGAYYTRYGYRIDSINNYYSMQGDYMKRNEHKVNAPNNDFIGRVYAAFVFDNVDMGITSPLHGSRFRFQLDQSFSDLKMYSGLIDYRKYHYFKPFSVGLRLLHHARFGDDSENIYPLYLGQSYYIRGYEYGSFANELSDNLQQTIIGSKMGLLNLELRLPLTGPERLSQIKSKYFFSDIVLFVDGGFSTYDYNNLNFSWNPNYKKNNIVFSTGMAVRINLFGFAVLEPYIAHPFQRNDKKMVFGLFIKGMDW